MFGDLDLKDTDPEHLQSDVTKALRQEAAKAEEVVVLAAHDPVPTDRITCVPIALSTLPAKFEIPEDSLLETKNVKEVWAKNPAKKPLNFTTLVG